MIWDYSGHIDSFYVKNNIAHRFKDDKPYMYTHAVSPECFLMGPSSFPWLYEDGYFLNLKDWEDGLPDLDLDIILYSCEHKGLLSENYDRYKVSKLRDKYPNAKIVGWVKEIGINFNTGATFSPEKYNNHIEYLNDCDAVALTGSTSFKELNEAKKLNEVLNKNLQFIESPLNISYMFDNFYSNEKQASIYAYLPHQQHRRGETFEFVSYLSNKYNIPAYAKALQEGQKFDYLTQKQFIELWSPNMFHFNLDPMVNQPGMQCRQVASVGSIHMGGCNESHGILYPETATCDTNILEEKFVEYFNDKNKRLEVIQYAWNKVNEIYSYDTIKKQISELVYE